MVLRLLLSFALLVAMCNTGHSQHFIFNRLSITDGLLSNNILTVAQDQRGYIWLGTENGLQRYDGTRFRTIWNERADQILTGNDGLLWVRSGKRIGRINPGNFTFTPTPYEGSNEVYGNSGMWLKKDASGRVFLLITGKSCQYYSEKSGGFSQANNPFSIPASLKIKDVVEDRDQSRYWIISGNDFGYWDRQTRQYYNLSNNGQADHLLYTMAAYAPVASFFIDDQKRYWIQTGSKSNATFLCYNSALNRFTSDTSGLNGMGAGSYFEVYGFKQLKEAAPAVYGLNCFGIYNDHRFNEIKTPANNPYGIQFNSVEDLLQSDDGTVWVATDNGLYFTSSVRRNIHILFSQEKGRASISSLFEDSYNNIWVGTWGRGTFLLNNPQKSQGVMVLKAINDLDAYTKLVWTICEDKSKQVWIGCQEGRLAQYDPETKRAILHKLKIFNNSAIRQIIKDEEGLLWLGLQDGRLLTYNPSTPAVNSSFREILSLNGLINRMGFINNHQLWIAVHNKGICIADIKTGKLVQSITVDQGQPSFIANTKELLTFNDTLCLIAGEKLGILNPQKFKINYSNLPGSQLPGSIFTLQKDQYGNCWAGGSSGIYKLNMASRTITRLTQQDGLITIHNNSYVPERSMQLRNGWLAFGGNQHLVLFNPAEYNNSMVPPSVNITGFQLNGRYLPEDSLTALNTINIPYEHRVFSIEFAAINFMQKGRLIYEYKLEGLNDEWISLTTPTSINYNFLPHGHYRFLVRAKNELGQYSPTITSLRIYIAPPFWKTAWFYILVGLAIVSLLFYLHRLRLQKLLHIEKVRSRLARDLHDDMGSTLSTINILSNMALQQPSIDEAKSKAYMSTISTSTSQMMEAMDDIVWSINPVNDNIAKMVARMKETAGAVLEPKQIDYRFEIAPSVTDVHLSMEARREVFLIFKEAINNIVKYAAATLVTLTFKRKGPNLLLTIEDNGIGFEMAVPGSTVRGNGLKNMQKRAAALKGQLSINSQPGSGTSLKLVMPIA
ncbi:two-component regulator propeller domain-containing protein [Niabella yanshanensis]|uniref:Two-component regulator propeller domain-containing protein n=1 Tax=Niabella yanshanensis TaxID=577386 RepID=A0ABZ0WC05_9BACT|nr:two-component regulator propeller domain-containing protein [Niabella yanshanensis]WQD40213.1 two-component regulator propeller domain-containing protein [Niabella yanshanensis]